MVSVAPSPTLLNAKLTAENVALEARVRTQATEIRDLRQENAELADTVEDLRSTEAKLKEALERLLARYRGRKKVDPSQGLLFSEQVAELVATIEAFATGETEAPVELAPEDALVPDGEALSDPDPKTPRKKADRSRRVVDESNLRREVKRSELPAEERRCPETGVELIEVGTKVTKELDYRPGELVLVEHHQVIYGPAPEIEKERRIEPLLAPPPAMAVEGVTASAALLAWLLCQKYVLHLPLYRQEDAFARLGVRLSRKTLCDWVLKAAFLLAAIAREIERQIRAGPVLQLDDTPVKCRHEQERSGRKKIKQSYLWVFVNPAVSGVVFRFTDGRATADLAGILSTSEKPSSIEVIVSDGLSTNRSGVREAGLEVGHAGCWAHLLRKFRDALPEAPAAMGLFLEEIGRIYEIEASGRESCASAKDLLDLRRREAFPHVLNVLRMTSGWKLKYSLKGKVAEAMRYARGQRRSLLTFLRDGRVPVDNNACERAIRPVAIGRGNWLFAGSVEGGEAAATIYTLVESAKASGVDPYAYLEAALSQIGSHPANRITELTPWAMAATLPSYRRRLDVS